MRKRFLGAAGIAAAVMLAVPGTAGAHPDHGGHGGREDFAGEGVISGSTKQHTGDEGHLPAKKQNVRLVGKAPVTNPSDPTPAGRIGRVADVFAYGDHAYLAAFRDPKCESAGVHVMDIKNLSKPREVTDAFIPTTVGSYVGEGVQVIRINNRSFRGDVLIHNNETCPGATPAPGTLGGISLWNVTRPTKPVALAKHAGDYTASDGSADSSANTVHSMWAWNDARSGKTYVALVDNEERADVDIMDISDPRNPVMVNDTLDLVELFGVDQASPPGLTSIFSHDMTVVRAGKRMVMNVNYWDGGYVLLDVTDPRPGKVTLIAESDYGQLDEERLKRGQEISPEGNSHQSEFSPNRKFMIGTDEDFNPYRLVSTIEDGPNAGTEFRALQAGDTPTITAAKPISGTTTFVGTACATDTIPAGNGGIAVVERGVCSFQEKLDTIAAAGYSAGIVFNSVRSDCDALVNMAAASTTVPFLFVDRATGLRLLNQEVGADACTQTSPAVGTTSAKVSAKAVFDGWGYVRLFATDIPKTGQGSIKQLDTYAIPESQDDRYATRFGDLSVHEVAMDPRGKLAYLSYYAGGMRVLEYGAKGMKEVGAFIDEGGNNFWGVEAYQRGGKTYILASDRDYGLYILEYKPRPGR